MIEFFKGTVTPRDWLATAGILGMTGAIVAGFYFFVHVNQKDDLIGIQTLDARKVLDLDQARAIDSQIEALRVETDQIKALVREFEERLPSNREIVSLLKEFQRMADEEDISVEFASLPRDRDERKETIPYKIVARGSFHQIAGFVNRLERFKRFLKISNLNVGPAVDGITRADFTLNTYRFIHSSS